MIGEDGKQIGVMPLGRALAESQKLKLDLVEIGPNAHPPVTKIVDLGKFLYQEEKKQRQEKKKAKSAELKEIRFSPFIAAHDFDTRLIRVKEFLAEKNKVRVVVVFKGKQLDSKNFGYGVLKKVLGELGEGVVIDMEPKFFGRHLAMVISPTNKPVKVEKIESKEQNA